MKKTIANKDQLDSVHGDKKKTGQAKFPAKAKPKQKPEGPEPGDKLIADAIDKQSKSMLMMMAQLQQQMQVIQMNQTEPVTEWVFDISRDERGFAKQIKAKAVPNKKALN